MAEYHFGSGVLFGRSTVQSNPTPVRFGGLQEVSVDISFTTKPLYGQYQFPIATGRGTAKITGKAKFAQFNAQAFNDLFFGNSSNPSSSSTRIALSEAATVTANTVNVSHNSTFSQDFGVVKASDGSIFTRVASGPVGQQYSCNESTGAYTFNSSQNNIAVLVSYTYTDSSNGKQISISNQLLGNSPQFIGVFTNTFNSKTETLILNSCMSSKLTLASKLEDWTMPEFDFEAYADASNNIGTLNLDE